MQKRSRADFFYRLGIYEKKPVLFIWDENKGNKSVTNDIENVVADIAAHERLEPKDHLILYRDSEGLWDGWDAATADFFPMRLHIVRLIALQAGIDLKNPQHG